MGIKSQRWSAIIVAFCFACSFVHLGSAYSQGPSRRDLQIWSPTGSKETSDRDREGSCSQSEIQHNVTLKGGILAGYFRKLAQYVAMQLCVELCCEEKGCDVAFMSGRNCYGVQCFSEDQCQSIPAKKIPSEPIFISHVTFKGEGAQTAHEPKNLQCSATRMRVGVTLRGGLKSGNFTDVGKVDNMVICTKLCCVAEKCDLAMMINQSCFLVSCYTMQLCQVIKAISTKYQPSVAYVMRRTGELQIETATKLQALHTADSRLMCKNSQIFYNSTLRGGYKAGNFTDLGKVANMSACVRLCCGDKNCDAAFMLETNCYAVACIQEDLCTPVHAKKSGALISLNPKISYITSRSEEVMSKKIISKDGSCHAGVISYDVTLKGGMAAGNFTPHGKVGSMETCIEKCCSQSACNAAMMLKDACFTVACYKDELCEKKPIPTSSSYNPKIAYVFREKKPTKKAGKKPPSTLLQRLKLLGDNPSTKHIPAKHHLRIATNNTYVNHYKSHRPCKTSKHRCYNSTERLTQLLNETSYTEEEMKHVTSNNLMDFPPLPIAGASKSKSLHEMVNSIMPSKAVDKSVIVDPTASSLITDLKTAIITTSDSRNSSSDLNDAKSVISDSVSRDTINHTDSSKSNNRTAMPTQINRSNESSSNQGKLQLDDPFLSLMMDDSGPHKSGIFDPTLTPVLSVKPSSTEHRIESTSKPKSENSVISLMPGLSLVGEDPGCTNSDVIRNVTLRGGITAGKFKDRGKMDDFRQCLKICCLATSCDLAFMLSNNCFSVECLTEELCEAVPARSASIAPPIMAYIYARSTPIAKRQVDASDSMPPTESGAQNPLFHVVKRTINVLTKSSPVSVFKKRSAQEDWADERTIPRLRLKIPNR